MSKTEFAMAMPKWVAEIEDEAVKSSIFALILSHNIDKKPFTEDGLKKELDDFEDLTEEQKKAVFDGIVSHKDK
jgi:hypothetical protein